MHVRGFFTRMTGWFLGPSRRCAGPFRHVPALDARGRGRRGV